MLAGALLVTIPLVVAPAAPPAGPLDADVVDTSAFPTVLIDFTVPPPLRSLAITPDMVGLGGGSVVSLAPVDAAGIVVALVIDDGPTVAPEVVEDAQGASVELVRNVGAGTKIALATPSGLQTALTSDRRANIARIAGITAEAPDVIPLPGLVLDAATRLAASTETDRHLVLVLGSAPAVDLDVLAAVVDAGEIEVHVVAPDGLDLGGLDELAVSSGGVVPSMPALVGEMDVATAAIAQRYRVEATVDGGGPRELAVVVDGVRHTATVDIPAPAPAVRRARRSSTGRPSPQRSHRRRRKQPCRPPPRRRRPRATSSGGGSATASLAVGCARRARHRARSASGSSCDGVAVADDVDAAVVVSTTTEAGVARAAGHRTGRRVAAADRLAGAVPVAARPTRGAAAARPRRSVSTRRTDPVPAAVESLPVEPADDEPEPEWLVSGDLRLRRRRARCGPARERSR